MESPIEVVRRFCAAWSDNMGAAELAAFFTENAVYHNIPQEPVTGGQRRCRGRAATMIELFIQRRQDQLTVLRPRVDSHGTPPGVRGLAEPARAGRRGESGPVLVLLHGRDLRRRSL